MNRDRKIVVTASIIVCCVTLGPLLMRAAWESNRYFAWAFGTRLDAKSEGVALSEVLAGMLTFAVGMGSLVTSGVIVEDTWRKKK